MKPAGLTATIIIGGFSVSCSSDVTETRSNGYLAAITQLVAIQKIGLPELSALHVSRATVSLASTDGCTLNPPLYVLGAGVDQSIQDGDHILKLTQEIGTLVLGTLAPPDRLSLADMSTITDEFLVLDEINIRKGQSISEYSEAEKIFKISTSGNTVRLAAKDVEFSVCKTQADGASARAMNVIASNTYAPSSWLSAVSSTSWTAGDRARLRAGATPPPAISGELTSARRYAAETSSDLALANVGSTTGATGTFVHTAGTRTWDRCSPIAGDPEELLCSGGARVRLEFLLPRRRFTLFGRETERYLRVKLNSEPVAASIYFGAMRHTAKTNTALDVRAEDIPKLRLVKAGFEACPYGSQWIARLVEGPRPLVEATCTLRKKAQPRR